MLPDLLRTSPNQGAIDGFPIKVYTNGIYQGRYTWNIPKDKWMTNMDDSLDTHCILCGENYDGGCFRALPIINGTDWSDEIHDIAPEAIKNSWTEVVSFIINSTDEDFKSNISNYFDLQSLIDYHVFAIYDCGLDSYGKNQIYMTYDGIKWIASMYDLDSTWGLYWNGEAVMNYDYAREKFEDKVQGRQGNLLYERLEQNFYIELQNRWEELKQSALSMSNIINRFERLADIMPSDLIKEDYASTTADGAYSNIPSIARNNLQQIRNFAAASIGTYAFRYCAALTALIIEKSDAICTLANINAFDNTPIASGTGCIYVPSALVDTYKANSVWLTFANQFRALEDYTVDGTITGELDASKI